MSLDNNKHSCKDGGACHHKCTTGCYREKYCVPLSSSDLNDNWEPLNHVVRAQQLIKNGRDDNEA